MSLASESSSEESSHHDEQKEFKIENIDFIPHRIFINQVDSFNAKYIASYLSDQYYGPPAKKEINTNQGEEQLAEEEIKDSEKQEDRKKFEIIGTKTSNISNKSEDILYTVDEESNEFKEELARCAFIIYDITRDRGEISQAISTLQFLIQELDKIKEVGPKNYRDYPNERVFILISTVMTWARTKLIKNDEDEGEVLPFSDINYRKRKAHYDYKDYLNCEREVMLLGKKHKKKIKAYVLCSGFTYGFEEECLDFFFKIAWTNEKYLPLFYPGNNIIPLIYVMDLAKIVYKIMETTPKKLHYILAVEPTPSKLKRIVKAISNSLGTGRIAEIMNLNEAIKFTGINEVNYKKFCINLHMEPTFTLENFQIAWNTDLSMPDNIDKIVEEFKTTRNLKPIRIYMHGPPGSGKTRLARKICEKYNLHYVSVATMIQETLQDLRDNITDEKKRIKAKEERAVLKQLEMEENEDETEDEEIEEEEDAVDIEEWEEQIRDIQMTLSQSEDNKLPEEQVIKLMRSFLMKNYCQNQGFVLDGFPKTIEQAKEMLGMEEEEEQIALEEEEVEEGQEIAINNPLLPHFVISLQASDSFLNKRMMKLKQKEIEGTRYTEDSMKRRLLAYRELNTEENTILNFFDEIEIHPILIDIVNYDTEDMEEVVKIIEKKLGSPISFGDTLEEVLVQQFLAESKLKLELEEMETQKKAFEQEAIEEYKNKMEEWMNTLETIKKEEEKVIIAEHETLRNYLMEFVFPILTKALIEVAKVKPEDPIDYVSEYLFRINPEAKMFDPSYSERGIDILNNCEEILENANK